MMKTQYIKPEIQMVLLEKKLMASNSISWVVDNSNTLIPQHYSLTLFISA